MGHDINLHLQAHDNRIQGPVVDWMQALANGTRTAGNVAKSECDDTMLYIDRGFV